MNGTGEAGVIGRPACPEPFEGDALNIPVVGIKPVDGPRDVEVVAQVDHISRYGFQRKGASFLVTASEAIDLVKRGVVALPSAEPVDESPAPVAAVETVKIDRRTKAFRAGR